MLKSNFSIGCRQFTQANIGFETPTDVIIHYRRLAVTLSNQLRNILSYLQINSGEAVSPTVMSADFNNLL